MRTTVQLFSIHVSSKYFFVSLCCAPPLSLDWKVAFRNAKVLKDQNRFEGLAVSTISFIVWTGGPLAGRATLHRA